MGLDAWEILPQEVCVGGAGVQYFSERVAILRHAGAVAL